MFEGFSSKAIDFLWGIGLNNYKSWVDEHRQEYKDYVVEPMKLLAEEVNTFINELNKDIPCTYSISRLNRDLRYSKNKPPYKESCWFTLKPDVTDWKVRPVYFFELKATEYFYGMGYYWCEPATMAAFRKYSDEHMKELEKIIKIYNSQSALILDTEKYKRSFNSELSAEVLQWYNSKSIDLMAHVPINDLIFSPDLAQKLKEDFKAVNEIYRYLWKIHRQN